MDTVEVATLADLLALGLPEEDAQDLKDQMEPEGYYYRLSLAGYLDCTEWSGPYPTADEAEAAGDEDLKGDA